VPGTGDTTQLATIAVASAVCLCHRFPALSNIRS
jgi:hypothetical protein